MKIFNIITIVFFVGFLGLAMVKALAVQAKDAEKHPIQVAMSAAFVSEKGIPVYDEITNYLSEKLGDDVELVTGLGYSTINSMIKDGIVSVGFVCGLPYVLMHDKSEPEAVLIAAPVMKDPRYKGQPKYYSDVIVRKDSPISSFKELKGKTYVYNEEISNSGYNLPRYHLVSLGLTNGFFGKVLRSGSHEESIRMVAQGEVDASSVDSLVLDYDRKMGFGYADQVKVIESIGPAGIPPVVVSVKTSKEVRERIQNVLLNMHKDPEGRRILDKALVDKFVAVDDSNYDDIRNFKQTAEAAGFTEIR